MLLYGNWAAGIPNAATAATIDRTTPNATVTTTSGGTAQSVIGAAAGSPAVAPGTLNSASVAFGGGTGSLNFNHTSANYVFAPRLAAMAPSTCLRAPLSSRQQHIYWRNQRQWRRLDCERLDRVIEPRQP
jgi:hypothetical protein